MPKYSNTAVAKKLCEARQLAAQSQTSVAQTLHITQQAYSRYENAQVTIPIRHLLKLCGLWQLSIDDFLQLFEEDHVEETPTHV